MSVSSNLTSVGGNRSLCRLQHCCLRECLKMSLRLSLNIKVLARNNNSWSNGKTMACPCGKTSLTFLIVEIWSRTILESEMLEQKQAAANAAVERCLTKRGLKDKPSSQIADSAVSSRRSQRLNKALQNGLMHFVPLCPMPWTINLCSAVSWYVRVRSTAIFILCFSFRLSSLRGE